jgi:hypothetical protein
LDVPGEANDSAAGEGQYDVERSGQIGRASFRVLVTVAISAAQALAAAAVIWMVAWLFPRSPLAGFLAGATTIAFVLWRGYSGMANDARNQRSPPLI